MTQITILNTHKLWPHKLIIIWKDGHLWAAYLSLRATYKITKNCNFQNRVYGPVTKESCPTAPFKSCFNHIVWILFNELDLLEVIFTLIFIRLVASRKILYGLQKYKTKLKKQHKALTQYQKAKKRALPVNS